LFLVGVGLQHGTVHTTNPYGLPLEYIILPQELKKVGMSHLQIRIVVVGVLSIVLDCAQSFFFPQFLRASEIVRVKQVSGKKEESLNPALRVASRSILHAIEYIEEEERFQTVTE